MNKIVCCHAVRDERLTVASPVTVDALTQLKSASTYEILYSPLLAQKIMLKNNGINVLSRYYQQRTGLDGAHGHSQKCQMHPVKVEMPRYPLREHRRWVVLLHGGVFSEDGGPLS